MGHRDTKWASALGHMVMTELLDARLPDTINLLKKKKKPTKHTQYLQSSRKWDMPVLLPGHTSESESQAQEMRGWRSLGRAGFLVAPCGGGECECRQGTGLILSVCSLGGFPLSVRSLTHLRTCWKHQGLMGREPTLPFSRISPVSGQPVILSITCLFRLTQPHYRVWGNVWTGKESGSLGQSLAFYCIFSFNPGRSLNSPSFIYTRHQQT